MAKKRVSVARGIARGLTLAIVAALAAVAPSGRAAAEPTVLRAVSVVGVDTDLVTQFKRYIDEVNKRLAGRVEIRLLGGPEVVKPFEHFQSMRAGVIDLALTATAYFVGETIEGNATLLLDPTDFEKYVKALRGTPALDILNQAYREKSGVQFLGTLLGGARIRFLMGKPVTNLDDLKGRRIRGFSAQSAKLIQYFGAAPQTVPPTDLYSALQKGIVDGALRAPADAWGFGERDVYKYMIAEPVQISTGVVFVATRVWDKLTPDVRQVMSSAAAERELEVLNYYAQEDANSIEKLKANGMRIIELSPADKKRLAEARASYWDEVVAKSPNHGARLRAILEPYSK